jgi:3',5'-cyclic-AMP phosphodiesterase
MLIAQISDTHIAPPGSETSEKYRTTQRLQNAIRHLMRLPVLPDVVILSGDCVENGSVAEYEAFQKLVRPLGMPLYAVPGNHDHRGNFLASFGRQGAQHMDGFVQYVVEGPVRIIALDTHVPSEPGGHLCDARLRWLEDRLAEAPDRPTLLFMHHPPFATQMPELDAIGLNAAALGAIIARYPNIERVLAGHIHQLMQCRVGGALAMTCPSAAFQFAYDPRAREAISISNEPAQCLLHTFANNQLITRTNLIASES